MAEIYHVFLTRFNLRTRGKERTLRQSDGWLDERFSLFEQYCFPSMLAQTRKDFSWLVYFDAETPESYKKRVVQYQQKMPGFLPRWIQAGQAINVSNDVLSLAPAPGSSVLSTRLDNDDGIHHDFVRQLRVAAEPVQESGTAQVFNFKPGLIISHKKVYQYDDSSNPFASLLENSQKPATIWGAQHVDIEQLGTLHQIGSKPMWLQVVHGKNVRNRIKGRRLHAPDMSGFSLPENLILTKNIYSTALENCTLGLVRRLFEYSLGLIKKTLKGLG